MSVCGRGRSKVGLSTFRELQSEHAREWLPKEDFTVYTY